MAFQVGLSYKAGGAELDGANSLTGKVSGGVLLSEGDLSNKLLLPDDGKVRTLYYHTIESSTGEDAGLDAGADNTFTAPTGAEFCTTWDGDFDPVVAVPAATGAYKPVFIKRLQEEAATGLSITVASSTSVIGTRLGAPTITLADGTNSIIINPFSAVTGASGYEYRYKKTIGGTYSMWEDVDRTVGATITPVLAGVEYTVQVRCYDSNGVGGSDTEVNTTPYWEDNFDGATLDTEKWTRRGSDGTDQTLGSATITVADGHMVIDSLANILDWAYVTSKSTVKRTEGVFRVKMTNQANNALSNTPVVFRLVNAENGVLADNLIFVFDLYPDSTQILEANRKKARMRCYPASGTVVDTYNGSGWVSGISLFEPFVFEGGDTATFIAAFSSTGVTFTLRKNDDVGTQHTTAERLWTTIRGGAAGADLWVMQGDLSAANNALNKIDSVSYKAS